MSANVLFLTKSYQVKDEVHGSLPVHYSTTGYLAADKWLGFSNCS